MFKVHSPYQLWVVNDHDDNMQYRTTRISTYEKDRYIVAFQITIIRKWDQSGTRRVPSRYADEVVRMVAVYNRMAVRQPATADSHLNTHDVRSDRGSSPTVNPRQQLRLATSIVKTKNISTVPTSHTPLVSAEEPTTFTDNTAIPPIIKRSRTKTVHHNVSELGNVCNIAIWWKNITLNTLYIT
jgi:hypothetical protein